MTSDEVTPPKHFTHDQNWQILIEFSLPVESGSEGLAVERISEAGQRLNWPAVHLERLKLALAKAIRNALERSHLSSSEISLLIRVLIPKGSEGIQAAGHSGDELSQPRVSEEVAQQAGRSSSRGWGFFLVQKQEDTPQDSVGKLQNVIELFLYQEKHPSFRQ